MKHIHYIILSVLIISGCNFYQIDKHYADYSAIVADSYNTKGWIPDSLILPSTTDLYSRTNVDVNSFMILFKLSQHDLSILISQLEADSKEFKTPNGLKTPSWWSNIDGLQKYIYTHESMTWWFAIDSKKTVVYCWGDQ